MGEKRRRAMAPKVAGDGSAASGATVQLLRDPGQMLGLLDSFRGKTAASMLGVGERKETIVDENSVSKAKLAMCLGEKLKGIQDAQQFQQRLIQQIAQLDEQVKGAGIHIARLEGAVGMLRELGVELPANVRVNANHPEETILSRARAAVEAKDAEGAAEAIGDPNPLEDNSVSGEGEVSGG